MGVRGGGSENGETLSAEWERETDGEEERERERERLMERRRERERHKRGAPEIYQHSFIKLDGSRESD